MADLLALVCGVQLRVCHFSIGILSQVWYLIVSIPDLCILTYIYCILQNDLGVLNEYNVYVKISVGMLDICC